MNSVEHVLYEELTHLVDRLSTSVPDGSLAQAAAAHPSLRKRLDEADAQLASARASLLEDYGRWRRALEDELRGMSSGSGVGGGEPGGGARLRSRLEGA